MTLTNSNASSSSNSSSNNNQTIGLQAANKPEQIRLKAN